MRSVALGITLLVIFAYVSREAQVVLEVALAIVFTLVLFVSVIVDLGKVYNRDEIEDEFETPLDGELAEDAEEPEEAEAIVVEAESSQEADKPRK